MMKTARNLDIAIVVSGDGDFAPAIRAVQEHGRPRRGHQLPRQHVSSDLIEVADLFTDITQLARVEKGSSRPAAGSPTTTTDLSMTEVPDKQTEGTGGASAAGVAARGRGRRRPSRAAARHPTAAAVSRGGRGCRRGGASAAA